MDEEHSTPSPGGSRRRLKIAGVAASAVLAVAGGAVISNALAADGAAPSATPAQAQQGYGTVPAQSGEQAPQQRGDGDGPRGHRGDCPGEGGQRGERQPGGQAPQGDQAPQESGTADTVWQVQ